MFNQQPQQNTKITKAIFKETGTYNDMTIRPFSTEFTPRNVELFNEVTQGGTSISAANLSGVANDFLKPSAQAQAGVQIDNGWNQVRLRFILEIEYYDFDGTCSMRKIVQGYTNHVGVSPSGHIDSNMILYFNNVMTLRDSFVEDSYGRSLNTRVAESSQLLRGDYRMQNMFGNQESGMTWLMRPQDVFNTMGRTALVGDEGVVDLRLSFGDSPIKKSHRKNLSAPHYVEGLLRGFRDVEHYADEAADFNDSMAEAAGTVVDPLMGSDKFFHNLNLQTTSFPEGGSVTYGELNTVYPELDHIANFIMSSDVMRSSQPYETHQAGQSEYWSGANSETIWSTILSHSLPSIMMDLMITKIVFTATNQTINGEHYVTLVDYGSFSTIDMSRHLDTFTTRLKSQILTGLSNNNMMDYTLEMMVDIMGDTRIKISVANGPVIDYATPSFCDGLFSPVLAGNQNHVLSVASDMQTLAGSVGTPHVNQAPGSFQPASGGYDVSGI